MSFNPILIVGGEPNSIFFEIFFKSIIKIKNKNPIILIGSKNILKKQMENLNYNFNINLIDQKSLTNTKISKTNINLIDIEYNQKTAFKKISGKSNNYINNSFKIAFDIIKKGMSSRLINGPVSKKFFLKKKYYGVTEFIADKFKVKSSAMLIYNKKLSVCPLTTHMPISLVSSSINQEMISQKVLLIDRFYKKI